jgi:cytochrome b involved in lipid metabolism
MSGEERGSGSEESRIVLTIKGKRYDVTDYAPVHPGEGHNDIYLEDWAGKDVTKVGG